MIKQIQATNHSSDHVPQRKEEAIEIQPINNNSIDALDVSQGSNGTGKKRSGG